MVWDRSVGGPPELLETGLEWYKLVVTDVSGTTVTQAMTIGFRNGTEVKGKAGGDLSTGRGNLAFFIFPAGFSKGDTMPNGFVNWLWPLIEPRISHSGGGGQRGGIKTSGFRIGG